MRRTVLGIVSAIAFIGSAGPVSAADPQAIDWSKVPVKSLILFYPGQSTYNWLVSPEHRGARQIKQGKACVSCHEGDEKDLGNIVVKGSRVEPAPIAGKNGIIDVAMRAAHDAEYVYFQFQWKTNLNREGRMHDYVRYDGKQWKWYGHDRNDKAVRSGEQPALYEDRFSIMLDDGKVPRFRPAGLLADLPRRNARHARSSRRRAGEEASDLQRTRDTMPTFASISPRRAPMRRRAGTRPSRKRRSPRSGLRVDSST